MIQRIALLIGGLGAAAVLAVALGMVNFAVAWPWNAANTANMANDANVASVANQPAAQAGNDAGAGAGNQNAQPQNKTVVDKVYIAPTPAPKVIHVANNAPSTQTPRPAAQPPAAAPRSNTSYDDPYPEQESRHNGGHNGGDD
jgi:hypothetical protein